MKSDICPIAKLVSDKILERAKIGIKKDLKKNQAVIVKL